MLPRQGPPTLMAGGLQQQRKQGLKRLLLPFAQAVCLAPGLAVTGRPVAQCALEADVMTCLLAGKVFVAEDLLKFGLE